MPDARGARRRRRGGARSPPAPPTAPAAAPTRRRDAAPPLPPRSTATSPRRSPPSTRVEPGDRLIVFVGKLIASKGVELLLAAFPLVLAREPRARLLIVGFGAFRPGLERLAEQLAAGDLEAAAQTRAEDGRELPQLHAFLARADDAYREAAQGPARSRGLGRAARPRRARRPAARGRGDGGHEHLPRGVRHGRRRGRRLRRAAGRRQPLRARRGRAHARRRPSRPRRTRGSPSRSPTTAVPQLAAALSGWLAAPDDLRAATRAAIVEATRARYSWEGVAAHGDRRRPGRPQRPPRAGMTCQAAVARAIAASVTPKTGDRGRERELEREQAGRDDAGRDAEVDQRVEGRVDLAAAVGRGGEVELRLRAEEGDAVARARSAGRRAAGRAASGPGRRARARRRPSASRTRPTACMRTWACERRAAICATQDVASVTALTRPEQGEVRRVEQVGGVGGHDREEERGDGPDRRAGDAHAGEQDADLGRDARAHDPQPSRHHAARLRDRQRRDRRHHAERREERERQHERLRRPLRQHPRR